MGFFRYIFLITILTGSTSIGFLLSKGYVDRLNELKKLSNLINIFEPEAIGIGGSFVYFSDVLLDRLTQNITKKQYLFNKREELIIIPAALGNDAGIIGSVI